MATAGELVIKIAADYAQLVTGMNDANARIGAFGRQVEAQTSLMQRGFSAAATAVKGFVTGLAVERIVSYGEQIQKTVGDMADMAENLKMNVLEFQAFQGAALLAGQSTEAVSTAIGKFNVFIGKASEGSREQIERLNELGVKILDVNGKLRPQADLMTEVARKLLDMTDASARAAAEVALFGKSGQAVSGMLEQWAKGTTLLNAELERMGLRHLPETIQKMDDLDKQAAIGAKRLEVFFAPIYAAVKSGVITALASAIDFLANAFNALDLSKLDGWTKALEIAGQIASGNVAGAYKNIAGLGSTTPEQKLQADIKATSDEIDKLRVKYEQFSKSTSSAAASDMASTMAQIQKLEARRADLYGRLESRTSPLPLPDVTVTGARNPGIKGAGDAVADELAKLWRAEQTAKAAMAALAANTGTAFEDARREAELTKSITEKVGDLWAKAQKDGGATLEQIQAQVSATLRVQDALKRYEQDAAKAEQTTRRLDDGTKDFTNTMEELDRQLKTGRLSQIAYDRAVYQATERQKDQAAELERFKGGLEGFSAGVEKAARDYAKANDEFSTGARTFNGFIGMIDQGLDVLAGTSSKTFEQIATDFGRMIAKMALQAALSPVFKWIMGKTGGMFGGGGIDAEIADWSSYGSGGGGGGILSWLGGLFGGGRATGGLVQPGVTYDVGEHGPERFTPAGVGTITPYSSGDSAVVVNLDMRKAEGARDPAAALEFGRKVKVAVMDIIANEKRPGGTLYAN